MHTLKFICRLYDWSGTTSILCKPLLPVQGTTAMFQEMKWKREYLNNKTLAAEFLLENHNEICVINSFFVCLPIIHVDLLIMGYGMLFIIREPAVIGQTWGCWFSSLFSIMLMEKLKWRKEAVEFAGIAGTQEYQLPPGEDPTAKGQTGTPGVQLLSLS